MKKQKEQTEDIVAVEAKDIKALPTKAKELYEELSKELNVKEMNELNPIVVAMAEIREFENIKYDTSDDESLSDSIDQYKHAKKEIGHFNAATKKAKSAIKKPILERGRKIDRIEKVFLGKASDVKDGLDKEFDQYLKEQEAKKKEKERKKNEKFLKEQEELKEKNKAQQLVIDRNNLFQDEMKKIVNKSAEVSNNLDKYNLQSLEDLLFEWNNGDLFFKDDSILLDSQKEEIVSLYIMTKKQVVSMLNLRIDKVKDDINKLKANPDVEAPTAPEAPGEDEKENVDAGASKSFIDNLSDIFKETVDNIDSLETSNEIEEKAKSSCSANLQGYLLEIIEFVNKSK